MSKIDRVLRSNLKLRHLQLLVALDQFRHLGRAAEFLAVTQPAVSKTLAGIERIHDPLQNKDFEYAQSWVLWESESNWDIGLHAP